MSASLGLALLLAPLALYQDPIDPDPLPIGPENIVIILADDVGTDMVGAYEPFYPGQPNAMYPNTTPVIDYLAQTGLLFENAWTNPVCSPTRAQILTGKQGLRSGIGKIVSKNGGAAGVGLDPAQPLLPGLIRAHSVFPYSQAALGKWHLADGNQYQPNLNIKVHPLGRTINPWFDLYAGSMYNLNGQSYNNWGKTFGTPIDPVNDECAPPGPGPCEERVFDYATVDTADDAIHLIATLPEPFFLYIAFNAAHTPIEAPLAPLTQASCQGGLVQGEISCTFGVDVVADTHCVVQWLDNEIGRIVCALESGPDKPTEPTTLVFLGDNGTRGAAIVPPFDPRHGKTKLYDGGINVPFIVKSRFVHPTLVGSSTKALVGSTDILATVARLTQSGFPADPLRDSINFLPVMWSGSPNEREYVYAENFPKNFVPDANGDPPPTYTVAKHRRAIRNFAGYKLIQRVTPGLLFGTLDIEEELYDVEAGPFEKMVDNHITDALNGAQPWAGEYAALRAQLDVTYPHLLQ